jgi:hypothetical protein
MGQVSCNFIRPHDEHRVDGVAETSCGPDTRASAHTAASAPAPAGLQNDTTSTLVAARRRPRALLRWAFDMLDLNRVQAETDTRNVASARVLEKLGFVREGLLREDCVVNGEVSDSWVYGLIRREWRPSSGPVPVR